MTKSLTTFVMIVFGIIVLFIMGKYLMSNHFIPSLNEFIASTTGSQLEDATTNYTPSLIKIRTPKGEINVFVANTPESLLKGLSNKESLSKDEGMLFIFPKDDNYSFWMKDMRFSLDIVWIDAKKLVVGITNNISPNTYPQTFLPPKPIRYVLEINTGGAKGFDIATGTVLDF